MATKVWTFNLEDGRHVVEMQHGYLGGKRVMKVDGKVQEQSRKVFDTGSEHRFSISGHPCVLRILTDGLSFQFELHVDGKLQ